MALNIKPIADRVVIEPSAAETTTASGNTMTVKVGDTVLYGKYAGTELKYEGKDYLIMREDEIYAIL